jgi:undecaprenyl-diphosphatase
MEVYQAFILGLFQGLTEFLPVSSSGHLVIGQKILGLEQPPVLFDILVHLGTLLAIIFYFNKRIIKFYQKSKNLGLIFVASLPAVLAGLFLNDYLETIFNSLKIVGLCLFLTAGLLFFSQSLKNLDRISKGLKKMKVLDAFIIGLLQSLALLPGVSRSGSTIVAGLTRGFKRKSAFAFSFYLGLPAMLGAAALQIPEMCKNGDQVGMALVGLITAAVTGFVALKLLEKVVLKGKLFFFGLYCFILGLIILASQY